MLNLKLKVRPDPFTGRTFNYTTPELVKVLVAAPSLSYYLSSLHQNYMDDASGPTESGS